MGIKNYNEKTQLKSLKKLGYFLLPKERKSALVLLILRLTTALIETMGVASIMPFIAVLSNPTIIQTNSILNKIFQISRYLGIETNQNFMIALGALVFLFLILSLTLNAFATYKELTFVEACRHGISIRLTEGYLNLK